MFFPKLKLWLFKLLFEERCVHCHRRDATDFGYLCEVCFYQLIPTKRYENLAVPYVDGFYTIFEHKGIGQIIVDLIKFKNVSSLARQVGKLAEPFLEDIYKEINPDYVTVVPPDPLKLWFIRGFNPPLEMVKETFLGKKVKPILIRRLNIRRPLSRAKDKLHRFRLVKNNFTVRKEYLDLVKGKTILVIDDVLTTGATASEVGKILKSLSVEKVYWFSFFRA
ncbi:MAG: phosphoribosyltransferase family protein [Aquificota bacterium]